MRIVCVCVSFKKTYSGIPAYIEINRNEMKNKKKLYSVKMKYLFHAQTYVDIPNRIYTYIIYMYTLGTT